MDETDTLTPRRERFCREYLVDLNGSKASIRAGYAAGSAHVTASRLLRNPKVAARISELQAETAKRLEVTVDSVMADLETLCQGAVETKQFGPAVRAKELQGKQLGLFRDRLSVDDAREGHDERLYARIALVAASGDRLLARQLFRNLVKNIGVEGYVFERPTFSDDQIDALISGDTVH